MFFNDYYNSPIGNITMASDGESLCGLWFDGQKYFASTVKGETEDKTLPVFEQTKKWLDIYFSGNEPDFMPKLSLNGSEFRKAVWDILLTIPYGSVMTYGEIAKIMAKQRGIAKMSAQAVGGAVGHNPISIIVPCHRVVGTNGILISVSMIMILLLRHRDGVIIQWIMSRLTVSHTKKIYFKMGMIAEQMVWET